MISTDFVVTLEAKTGKKVEAQGNALFIEGRLIEGMSPTGYEELEKFHFLTDGLKEKVIEDIIKLIPTFKAPVLTEEAPQPSKKASKKVQPVQVQETSPEPIVTQETPTEPSIEAQPEVQPEEPTA